jgi:hypothetical protein
MHKLLFQLNVRMLLGVRRHFVFSKIAIYEVVAFAAFYFFILMQDTVLRGKDKVSLVT